VQVGNLKPKEATRCSELVSRIFQFLHIHIFDAATIVVLWQLKGVLAEHVTDAPLTCCSKRAIRPP
jgi:hypothetical protein